MSSLRNAVKRITHKERAQPQSRAKLGFLEKKKDYKIRAADYHAKQGRIRTLRERASMRNPDEFYFGMHNAVVGVDGRHRATEQARQKELEDSIGAEAVRIMKTQDLAYIRMQQQFDAHRIERLKATLHDLREEDDEDEEEKEESAKKKNKRPRGKHTIFVQTSEEAEAFSVEKHFETVPELAGRAYNRPRRETLERAAVNALRPGGSDSDDGEESEEENESSKKRGPVSQEEIVDHWKEEVAPSSRGSRSYRELNARKQRLEALKRAEAHLMTEKSLAAPGKKRKVQDAENGRPAVYRWSQKRAR